MVGFKKLFSRFLPNKDGSEPEPDVEDGDSLLENESSVRLRKNHQNDVDLQNGPPSNDNDFPTKEESINASSSRHFRRGHTLRLHPSRENSNNVEPLAKRVYIPDAVVLTSESPSAPLVQDGRVFVVGHERPKSTHESDSEPQIPFTDIFLAHHRAVALLANIPPAPSHEKSVDPASSNIASQLEQTCRGAFKDRGNAVYPNPYADASESRVTWASGRPSDALEVPFDYDDAKVSQTSYRGRASRSTSRLHSQELEIPRTRNIHLSDILKGHVYPHVKTDDDVNIVDSAIAFEEPSPFNQAYPGKGKGRAVYIEQATQSGGPSGTAKPIEDRHNEPEQHERQYPPSEDTKNEPERHERQDQLSEDEIRERTQKDVVEEEDHKMALELQEQEEKEAAERKRLAEERARLRDCVVCGDSQGPIHFPARPPTAKCEHEARTCVQCLQTWMASEFEMKGCTGIKCPECPQKLEFSDVRRAASVETFDAYESRSTYDAISSLDEFAWCLNPRCKSGQLNFNNDNFMACVDCGYTACIRHKCAWHANLTCEQYESHLSSTRAKQDEKKTEAMLDSVSKKCPNPLCGWRIQKIAGCDHMTCRRCWYEFCWQCFAPQAEIRRIGNTAHAEHCQYHSKRLEVAFPFNVH